MTSTFTSAKLLELPATGDQSSTWGTTINSNLTTIDAAIGGVLSLSVAGSADVTLSNTQASYRVITCTGTLTGNINLIVPARTSTFVIFNNTSGAYTLTVKVSGGTGVAVGQGYRHLLYTDGTNVYDTQSEVSSLRVVSGLTVAGSGITVTGNSTITGTLTGLTGLTVASGSVSLPSGSVANSALANSSVTIGSTSVSLGSTASTIAGLTSITAATHYHGASGSVVGAATFYNATSGSIVLQPTTGALGSSVITMPALTGTMTVLGNTTTGSGSTLVLASSPSLTTPALGVATGTSLALNGATLGTNALAVTGTANISGNTIVGGQLWAGGATGNPAGNTASGGGQIWFTQAASTTGFAQFFAISDDFGTNFNNIAIAQQGSAATGTTLGLSNAHIASLSATNVSNFVIQTVNNNTPIYFGTSGVIAFKMAYAASASNYLIATPSNGGAPSLSTNGGGLSLAPNSGATTVTGTLGVSGTTTAGTGSTNYHSFAGSSNNPTHSVSGGNLVLGSGTALSTSATTGHVMIPTCAGTPTGAPANNGTGQFAIIYDSTNNKLYVYNGAWKGVALS